MWEMRVWCFVENRFEMKGWKVVRRARRGRDVVGCVRFSEGHNAGRGWHFKSDRRRQCKPDVYYDFVAVEWRDV